MKRLLLLLSVITLLSCSNDECEEQKKDRINNILEAIDKEPDERKREALRDIILEEQNKSCD